MRHNLALYLLRSYDRGGHTANSPIQSPEGHPADQSCAIKAGRMPPLVLTDRIITSIDCQVNGINVSTADMVRKCYLKSLVGGDGHGGQEGTKERILAGVCLRGHPRR